MRHSPSISCDVGQEKPAVSGPAMTTHIDKSLANLDSMGPREEPDLTRGPGSSDQLRIESAARLV